jgi:hypothetical protein
MKSIKPLFALSILCLLAWAACKDDDGNVIENPPVNRYEACCGVQAVEATTGQGHVYIPNIFTPNGDGINDAFMIFADDNIEQIEELKVKDQEGVVAFAYFNFPPSRVEFGWMPSEKEAPGGLYNFRAVIRSTGNVVDTVSGSVCVYRCKTEADSVLMENISNCQWPTQNDGAGGHDPFFPAFETDECF